MGGTVNAVNPKRWGLAEKKRFEVGIGLWTGNDFFPKYMGERGSPNESLGESIGRTTSAKRLGKFMGFKPAAGEIWMKGRGIKIRSFQVACGARRIIEVVNGFRVAVTLIWSGRPRGHLASPSESCASTYSVVSVKPCQSGGPDMTEFWGHEGA